MRYVFICAFIAFINCQAAAQESNKIETDRPGETQSAELVKKSTFQAEFGFRKNNEDEDNYKLFHPAALLRYGLGKRVELRLQTDYITEYQQLIPDPKTTTGIEPVQIGTKISLFEEKGALPKTAFIGQIGLPFLASKELKPDEFVGSFRFAMENSLSNTAKLGYNLGLDWNGESGSPSFVYTFSPTFDLSEKWFTFIEVYGFIAKDNFQDHTIDGGFAYRISPNAQVDFGWCRPVKSF